LTDLKTRHNLARAKPAFAARESTLGDAMHFDLIDLRLFVAVADAGSITHGARRANLALASASARITRLERVMGTPLFFRSRRGVTLTAAGESLRDHARVVLNDIDAMRGDMAAHARGLRATVRLLTNTAGLSEHLPQPLAGFLRAHPTINIDVEERESADIVAAIAAGAADIGLAIGRDLPPSVTGYPFCRDRLMLAVPAGDALAKRRVIAFAELPDRDFVGLDGGSALQAHLAARAAHLGKRLRFRARLKSFDAVCQMVATGIGLAIVPEAAIRRCARTMPIKAIRLSDAWASRDLVICVRDQGRLSAPVRDLVAHLRHAAVRPN
jgi:DNA-binding transcriptional LysR family regulator